MDGELIKKALCFHGKPMQKIWDDERGVGDLQVVGVPDDGNYSIYNERQKYFTFQDRAKRLKLHQFLARKANDLYDKDLGRIPAKPIKVELDAEDKNSSILAQLPAYEVFLTKHQDKVKRYTLESIKTGDIIYAVVTRGRTGSLSIPLVVKPLCTDESNFRMLHDYNIKSVIPAQLRGPPLLEKFAGGATRGATHDTNTYVRCEVIDFSIDAERMTLSLMPNPANKDQKLGKISSEELPGLYCKYMESSGMEKYEGYLTKAKEFENPNYDILYGINGLSVNDNFTLMSSLKNGFPSQEYAKELRQLQASKWAFRSVAEGIEYFKVGQHVEAFQCLNKALNIDPRNVEGLVARGALYANKGSFLKAVEDFEKALKLNAFHVNARKYMGETLVALGRSYEEDNRIQDAAKAYRDCLNIIPKHEQATMLLEAIQQRTGASVEIAPPAPAGKIFEKTEHGRTLSLSNGSGSEGDSSDSSSDSDEENVGANKKEGSLSPLSKKMALHAQQMESTDGRQRFHQPFYMSQTDADNSTQPQVVPNEFKLDEDDTESRVRKLLHNASKHKKDKKKSKKSKKTKKSKKSSKPSKESSKVVEHNEFNYIGVDVLTRENALNANLKQYEKSIQELKKRQLQILEQPSPSNESSHRARSRERSETPPPPPSIKPSTSQSGDINKYHTIGFRQFDEQAHSSRAVAPVTSTLESKTQKFSFQIKKPVKVDKCGLIRLATPATNKSPTPPPTQKRRERLRSHSPKRSRSRKRSPSRKRSRSLSRRSKSRLRRRSRTRSRSRSVGRRRRWRSRTRSRSRGRYESRRGRRSSSRTRSSSRSGSYSGRRKRGPRSRSRSRRRRTPSPFVPRGTASPRRHSRCSPSSPRGGGGWRGGRGRGSLRGGPPVKFGNRVWKNPNAEVSPDKNKKPSSSDDRWPHDKFENPTDDPTIEEIDEIISKAQKERKQNIINNDKDILKKSSKW